MNDDIEINQNDIRINQNDIRITAIQGIAGTAKTTTLAKIIAKLPKDINFIALAYTHHAVKNLLSKVKQYSPYINSNKFKTIHSYFRIDFKNDFFMGSNKNDNKYIFIDEFSMIDKELFKRIIYDSKLHNVKEIFLAGDFLQLATIGSLKDFINISTLKKILKNDNNINININSIEPLRHFDSSCLTLANRIVEKTVQYRNTNNHFLDNFMNNTFNEHLEDMPYVNFDECIKLLQNNYTLIASTYKTLDIFKNELYEVPKKGDFIYGTETINDIINGNIYVIMNIENDIVLARDIESDELIFFNKPYKFYPLNLYTFHKSQGLTFKNVIICTDNLFEFPMLYTGITRASNDIKFYSSKDKNNRIEYLKKHSGQAEIAILKDLFKHLL